MKIKIIKYNYKYFYIFLQLPNLFERKAGCWIHYFGNARKLAETSRFLAKSNFNFIFDIYTL